LHRWTAFAKDEDAWKTSGKKDACAGESSGTVKEFLDLLVSEAKKFEGGA